MEEESKFAKGAMFSSAEMIADGQADLGDGEEQLEDRVASL